TTCISLLLYLYSYREQRHNHSFPTRRSSDLRFPQYRHVIPTSFDHKIEVPRQALLSAVRQSMIVTNEESRGVELAFSPSDLRIRSEEHTSELQSREKLVCRLLLEKKNINLKL